MLRRLTLTMAAAALTGCVGNYADDFGTVVPTVNRFGSVVAVPTTAGSFAGIADADRTVVSDATGNGYAFAYADVNAADYGTGSGRANLAIAGLLPGTDVGITPTTGSARMTGIYNMVVVDNASAATDPATWTVTRPTGTVTADIDFSTGRLTGRSGDGALTLTAPAGTGFANGFIGDASYNGTPGQFAGVLGNNAAVATVTGQGGTGFYAGGFSIGR